VVENNTFEPVSQWRSNNFETVETPMWLRPFLVTVDPVPFEFNLTRQPKGAITSKIKHAIKLKTSSARLAQVLQPPLAFCFSLKPMTAYRPVLDGTLSLAAI